MTVCTGAVGKIRANLADSPRSGRLAMITVGDSFSDLAGALVSINPKGDVS
jgi:hypothetical protein